MSLSAAIVDTLLEANREDLKAFARDVDPQFELYQIKATNPGFFARANNRYHGTNKWRVFKGNYVVGNYVRKRSDHFMERGFIVYKYEKSRETGEYDLRHVGTAEDKDELKKLIAGHRAERQGLAR